MFLFQYHNVLIITVLYYVLESGRFVPPAPFFFLKIALGIWCLLYFIQIVNFFILVLGEMPLVV